MPSSARTVYDFRRGWLEKLIAEHGGVEQFAEKAGRNSKHVSAMRGGAKNMGPNVARDIERELAKRGVSSIYEGMLDTDPLRAPYPQNQKDFSTYAVNDSGTSQPVRIDVPTMRRSMTMLMRLAQAEEFVLDPVEDLDLVVRVYELALESGGSYSADNVILITDWVRKRGQERGNATRDQGNRRTGSRTTEAGGRKKGSRKTG